MNTCNRCGQDQLDTIASDIRSSSDGAEEAELTDEFLEALRLEAGSPVYGRDITIENLPQEVGRDSQCISFNKGCYLGQEPVARIDALGHVNRNLVGLLCEGAEPPASGTPIEVNGKVVGAVTSSAFSPARDQALAMAYVRREYAMEGERLQWAGGAGVVTPLPIS